MPANIFDGTAARHVITHFICTAADRQKLCGADSAYSGVDLFEFVQSQFHCHLEVVRRKKRGERLSSLTASVGSRAKPLPGLGSITAFLGKDYET
jgi:hypothetical protein